MGGQGDSQGKIPRATGHLCANCAPKAHGLASEGRAAVFWVPCTPFAGLDQHNWLGGQKQPWRKKCDTVKHIQVSCICLRNVKKVCMKELGLNAWG